MRNEHQIEKSFKDWLKAGYGGKQIHPIQEQEVKRAFMAGVFEGLNFVINQEGNLNAERVTIKLSLSSSKKPNSTSAIISF